MAKADEEAGGRQLTEDWARGIGNGELKEREERCGNEHRGLLLGGRRGWGSGGRNEAQKGEGRGRDSRS